MNESMASIVVKRRKEICQIDKNKYLINTELPLLQRVFPEITVFSVRRQLVKASIINFSEIDLVLLKLQKCFSVFRKDSAHKEVFHPEREHFRHRRI